MVRRAAGLTGRGAGPRGALDATGPIPLPGHHGLSRRAVAVALLTLLAGCATTNLVPVEPTPSRPSVTPPVPPAPVGSPVARAVHHALEQLGTPYRFGGASPEGFDCSGLVQYAYARAGVRLPRATGDQRRSTRRVASPEGLRPGDLLFFQLNGRDGLHVAISLGDRRFVHAPSTGGVVRVESLEATFWRRSFLEARRLLES